MLIQDRDKGNMSDEVIVSVLEELIEAKQHRYEQVSIYFTYSDMRLLFYRYIQHIKGQGQYVAFIENIHVHVKDKGVIGEFIEGKGAMHIDIGRYIPMYVALGWWRDTRDRDSILLKSLLHVLRLYIGIIEHRKMAERVMMMRMNANNYY